MAGAFAFMIPNFSTRSVTEGQTKLIRLGSDVRAAFDMAVLTGKPYRLVFEMYSGLYWLEECDHADFFFGDQKLGHDPTEEEEKEQSAAFDEEFKEYESAAGDAFKDPSGDKELHPSSPLIQAKEKLRPPKWTRVNNLEWQPRPLGPVLIIKEMQAEHHATKQTLNELGEKARGMIYFMPGGYAERSVIYLAYRKGDADIDETKTPYTIKVDSYSGTIEMVSGTEEVDVNKKDEAP